jgi:hypothetical protein
MAGFASDPAWKRQQKETALAGRKFQRDALQFKLDHLVETGQDTTAVARELADVKADIERLEDELRQM